MRAFHSQPVRDRDVADVYDRSAQAGALGISDQAQPGTAAYRIGATTRQLAGAVRWQALFGTVAGIATGGAVSVIGLDRVVTGTSAPYVPAAPAPDCRRAAAVTFGTVMVPHGVSRVRSG